jgi:hypothetical protein
MERKLKDEACALLDYLESRGLNGNEASAIMGIAIAGLLRNDKKLANFFMATLQKQFDEEFLQ